MRIERLACDEPRAGESEVAPPPRLSWVSGATAVLLACSVACGGTGAADTGSTSPGTGGHAGTSTGKGKGGATAKGGASSAGASAGMGAGIGGNGDGGTGVGVGAGGSAGQTLNCTLVTPDPGNDDKSTCMCTPPSTRSCYTGNAANAGVGICKRGTQVCSSVGSGEITADQWSPCMGSVPPGKETCNGLDDDCNGKVDEGCCTGPIECTTTDGKPGTAGCVMGVQQPCVAMPCTSAQDCDQSACCATQFCITMGKKCCTGPVGCMTPDGKSGSSDCVGGVAQPCKAISVTPCNNLSDCGNPACCLSPICAQEGAGCDPGGCAVGQVMDPQAHVCRNCEATDCQLIPALCCAAPVCNGAPWCSAYLCGNIAASCNGKTSACNNGDLDEDDSFGDCDEAFDDPCCPCKVAVGCGFGSTSLCGYGAVVKNNTCVACTAGDCKLPPCMGLNGCPTNCPKGQFFNGAYCEACFPFLSMNIPACNVP